MDLVDISLENFFSAYTAKTAFGSSSFIKLNADKADAIMCLSMISETGKHLVGMVIGERNNELLCPFSAPFGEIYVNGSAGIEQMQQFATLLHKRLVGKQLRITLASMIYNEECISKISAALTPLAQQTHLNLSYHYPTLNISDYKSALDNTSRKHFNRAGKAGFSFEKTDDLSRAYAVIRQNREEKGYYLSMTEQQVRDTAAAAVKADYFVMSVDGNDAASAIVFHVAEGIVQVVYWGHLEQFNDKYPMSLLAYKVFEYYSSIGIKTVDLGTAHLDNGVPNIGLCKFKESIGAIATLKPTFVL